MENVVQTLFYVIIISRTFFLNNQLRYIFSLVSEGGRLAKYGHNNYKGDVLAPTILYNEIMSNGAVNGK